MMLRGLRLLTIWCVLLFSSAAPILAEPLLWRVSDADSSVHLFGSTHFLGPGLEWRSARFEQVLAEADEVFFEIDLGVGAMAAVGTLMAAHGYLPEDQTLADILTPEQYEAVATGMEASGFDLAEGASMQPWLLELMLSFNQDQMPGAAGFDVIPGVDFILSAEIEDDRRRSLETLDEQLSLLYSRPVADQVESLLAALQGNATLTSLTGLGDLLDAWKGGNAAGIATAMIVQLGGTESYFYRALLTDRNLRWVGTIENLLRDNENALVVAGVGHFVGPTSVTALLEERGYTIELVSEPYVAPPAWGAGPVPAPGRNAGPRGQRPGIR